MAYYVIEQENVGYNSSITTVALVTNPRIEGGAIRARKIGVVDWDKSASLDLHKYAFKKIIPVDFIIIGNATCEEISCPIFCE